MTFFALVGNFRYMKTRNSKYVFKHSKICRKKICTEVCLRKLRSFSYCLYFKEKNLDSYACLEAFLIKKIFSAKQQFFLLRTDIVGNFRRCPHIYLSLLRLQEYPGAFRVLPGSIRGYSEVFRYLPRSIQRYLERFGVLPQNLQGRP